MTKEELLLAIAKAQSANQLNGEYPQYGDSQIANLRDDEYDAAFARDRDCNCGSGEPWASCGENSGYCG